MVLIGWFVQVIFWGDWYRDLRPIISFPGLKISCPPPAPPPAGEFNYRVVSGFIMDSKIDMALNFSVSRHRSPVNNLEIFAEA